MRLIVIGGGAAGFFCAVTAAAENPSLQVVLVEKTGKLLSKVRVSGGGRCNVTHACFSISDITSRYPRGQHFVRKAFHRFFTTDTIEWFRQRAVALKVEDDGRMFPVTDSSQTIIDCLLKEARDHRVEIVLHREVKELTPSGSGWLVHCQDGQPLEADAVCVACGGYPKPAMFGWLSRTGHHIEAPVPSLFTFNIPDPVLAALMGVSVLARVRIAGTKWEEQGPVLITHWGLSGPAVLRLSARAARELHDKDYRFTIVVNWLPNEQVQSLKQLLLRWRSERGGQKLMGRNELGLPQRLWEYLCVISEAGAVRWAELSAGGMNRLAENSCAWQGQVQGKTTFKEEFVTAGGIRLSEIDPQTMESRICPGLYFAGEIMDVDGVTGGFNFQHAWTSGWIAGHSIGRKTMPGEASY